MKKDEASLIAEGHKALFNAVSKMASTRSESPLRPNDSEGAREAKPGIFTSSLSSKNWQMNMSFEPEEPGPPTRSANATGDHSRAMQAFTDHLFKAHELSCEYNLPGGHVTQAWKLFKRYDVDNDGLLAPYEFQLLLRHVLRERFPSAKDDQRFMRFIARKFQVHVTDVESVKRHFDSYSHHTGRMECLRFHKLLALLLNLQDVLSLPESRVKSFWRELAGDHNGFVEFSDFIPWYLACFAGGDGSPLAPRLKESQGACYAMLGFDLYAFSNLVLA
eukprot:g31026.t1